MRILTILTAAALLGGCFTTLQDLRTSALRHDTVHTSPPLVVATCVRKNLDPEGVMVRTDQLPDGTIEVSVPVGEGYVALAILRPTATGTAAEWRTRFGLEFQSAESIFKMMSKGC